MQTISLLIALLCAFALTLVSPQLQGVSAMSFGSQVGKAIGKSNLIPKSGGNASKMTSGSGALSPKRARIDQLQKKYRESKAIQLRDLTQNRMLREKEQLALFNRAQKHQ